MEAGIDRNNAKARLEAGQHGLQKLSAVPLENCDAIALPQSKRSQRQHKRVDSKLFLRVRRVRLAVSHGQTIRNLLGGSREVGADVRVGGPGQATPVYAQRPFT